MTSHTEAIAALIIMDMEIRKDRKCWSSGKLAWTFRGLLTPLNRCERQGFAHGALIRETLPEKVPGFGSAFAPVKRVTPAMREEVARLINAHGARQVIAINGRDSRIKEI